MQQKLLATMMQGFLWRRGDSAQKLTAQLKWQRQYNFRIIPRPLQVWLGWKRLWRWGCDNIFLGISWNATKPCLSLGDLSRSCSEFPCDDQMICPLFRISFDHVEIFLGKLSAEEQKYLTLFRGIPGVKSLKLTYAIRHVTPTFRNCW